MQLDLTGRKFIQSEEGLRLKAYLCSAGVPTIGYGNTYYPDGRKVKIGDTITREDAEHLFTAVASNFEKAVTAYVKVKLTQNQFNALVSLSFNIGIAAFKGSTLLKRLNAGSPAAEITAEFLKWKNAGGKPILLSRRKREVALYLTP